MMAAIYTNAELTISVTSCENSVESMFDDRIAVLNMQRLISTTNGPFILLRKELPHIWERNMSNRDGRQLRLKPTSNLLASLHPGLGAPRRVSCEKDSFVHAP